MEVTIMAMVVQHNLTAMNASRMLGVTTGQQSKQSEKLASGYRINRASDDAAGLAISEKMRKQVRGLTRASANAQDGVSAVQTAEGALTEVHSMLQRMNELAVQSANGTNSEVDRDAIQAEIDQLITEIDRVAETTKFNETYLLKGTEQSNTETVETAASASFEIIAGKEFAESYKLDTGKKFYAVDAKGNQTELTDATDPADLAKYINSDGTAVDGYKIYKTTADGTGEFGAQITNDQASATEVLADLKTTKTGLMDSNEEAVAEEDLGNYFDTTTGVYNGGLYSINSNGQKAEIGAEQIKNFVKTTVTDAKSEEVTTKSVGALEFKLHVGSEFEDTNKITIEIKAMSAAGIGVDTLKETGVKTQDAATDAIDVIEQAIQKVSEQRSALGAVQNRLEHTIANLDNVVENTTAAESRIRDTDMAATMVEYSKNNILAQAGQSMLAQANQSTQGVLSLLQ